MPRRVFFSFHHGRDAWRVWQVRNCNVPLGYEDAGFFDEGEWRDLRTKGEAAIKAEIRKRLDRSSVTVVLIGHETAYRLWVQWEIAESLKRGNGLVGVYINHLRDRYGDVDTRGPLPYVPPGIPFPLLNWNAKNTAVFKACVEAAGKRYEKVQERRRIAAIFAKNRLRARPALPRALPMPPEAIQPPPAGTFDFLGSLSGLAGPARPLLFSGPARPLGLFQRLSKEHDSSLANPFGSLSGLGGSTAVPYSGLPDDSFDLERSLAVYRMFSKFRK